MKIETQMIQNSIFTFKRIDEQNGSLHQHKSTFVLIDYYQGFKPSFLRLILREFRIPRTKQKNAVTDTQYIEQSVHTYDKLLNNQSIIASICPFFVLHQWLLHAKLTKPSEALTRCYVT